MSPWRWLAGWRVRSPTLIAASLCALAVLAAWCDIARAADVEVRVLNVADASGSVRVAVCTEAQWLQPNCALGAHVAARAGMVVAVVRDVPPGTYGVLAHHDINGDGQVNRSLLGIPTEGIGFSRDAPMRFGPPRFVDAVVQVGRERAAVPVRLLFEPDEVRRSPSGSPASSAPAPAGWRRLCCWPRPAVT